MGVPTAIPPVFREMGERRGRSPLTGLMSTATSPRSRLAETRESETSVSRNAGAARPRGSLSRWKSATSTSSSQSTGPASPAAVSGSEASRLRPVPERRHSRAMLAHRLGESPRPHRHGRAGSGPDREPMACRCCRGLSRRRFLGGAAVATTLPLAGCDAAVPDWLADLLVPEPLAAELGAQAFREVLRATPPVRDADLQRRLAGTGERIVAASGAAWSDWQFVVLDGPSPNAF